MAVALQVLADPNRQRIVELLRTGELPVGALVEALQISQPSVSKHLRALRENGFVDVRVDAHRRYYSLDPGPLRELDAWLQPFRALWSERLDALERHLDTMATTDEVDEA